MKRRIQLALMGCVLSIAAHLYLTVHYYPIKFGLAVGESMCNLNAKFDCDAVSASSYSDLFGIPVALWGSVFYVVLFLLILLSWLEWSDHPERLRRWTVLMAGAGALASVVMAGISLTVMHNYCVVCMGLYALSFVVFFSVLGLPREPWTNLKDDIPRLWGESRGLLLMILSVPLIAFLTHRMFTQNLGGASSERDVIEGVRDWQSSPKVEFVAKPSLTSGPSPTEAKMTLTEFADFTCPHCKHASYTLHAFVRAHPEVRFEYYSWPLEGSCDDKTPKITCRLAAAALCADKDGKGWEMHDLLFEKQETIRMSSIPELDKVLADETAKMGLNWESFARCLGQSETIEAINAQSKQGTLAGIRGTPTVFANGKILTRGSLLPVLQKVLEQVKN